MAGTNDFLRTRELKKLVEHFVSDHGDIALEKLDGEESDLDSVMGALTSPSLLSNKKMVVLSQAANNKSLTEHIDDILSSADDTTDLIINEAKLDKRSVYYKTLKSQKGFKEFGDQDENSLSKWLVETAKELDAELSLANARHLIGKIGLNQQHLASELEKLTLYDKEITKASIDLLVEASPRSTVFELLDAAFGGDTKRALRLYKEQRRLRVDPQAILALMSWQLHVLALIKTAGNRSPSEIARDGGVSPFVVSKSLSGARRLTFAELKSLIHDALTLDVRLKSEPIDPDSALQNLLITIAG